MISLGSENRVYRLLPASVIKKQVGQVLPLGLVLMAFSIFMTMTLFNTGQLSAEKMRVTNAADSAAYSGLLWQARALNFQAYTNRAMVANQVSIAQAVSLRSWAQYGRISTANVNTVLGSLPFVGAVTNAFQVAADSAATVIEPVAEALLFTADTVNQALSVGQEIMYMAGAAATPEVVRNVAKANNDNFKVASAFSLTGMAENAGEWAEFTDSYGSDSEAMQARAQIINDSRDDFSRQRNWDLLPVWFFSTPLTRHNVIRRGETRLIYVEPEQHQSENGQTVSTPGYWEWKAKDSVSLQTRIWRILGTKRIEVPIGWAQAHANDRPGGNGSIEPCQPPDDFTALFDDGCPKWLGMNKVAERLASTGVPGLGGTQSKIDLSHLYHGLRDFRDLKGFPDQENDPRLELRVEVYTDTNATDTTSHGSYTPVAPFDAQINTARNELAAVAKSELYFHRPEMRSLGDYVEYANGYNPFWDVRLKALDTRERLAAVFLRAEGVLTPQVDSSVPTTGIDTALSQNGLENLQTTSLDSVSSSDLTDGGLPSFDDLINGAGEVEVPDLVAGNFSLGVSDHFITSALAQPATVASVESWINSEFQLDASMLGDAAALLPMFDTDALAAQLSDRYRDEVEEVIETVAEQLLTNALTGFGATALGGDLQNTFMSLQSQAETVVDGLANAQNQIENTLNTLEVETQQQLNELEQIRDDVVDEFNLAIEDIENEIAGELLEIQSQADVITQLLEPTFNGLGELGLDAIPDDLVLQFEELGIDVTQPLSQQARDLLQDELNDLAAEQTDTANSEQERQAIRLVEIIENATDLYPVTVDTAIQVLQLMQEVEEPEDPLSVTDVEEF